MSNTSKKTHVMQNFYQSVFAVFRACPGQTIIAFILCFGTNFMILYTVSLQAQIVELAADHMGSAAGMLCAFIMYALASALFRLRGYFVLPIFEIIDNSAGKLFMGRLLKALPKHSFKRVLTEDFQTRLYHGIEQIDQFQMDVMTFADTLSGIITIAFFGARLIGMKWGLVFFASSFIICLSKKCFSIIITKREVADRQQQTISRRQLQVYGDALLDQYTAMEFRYSGNPEYLFDSWERTAQRLLSQISRQLAWKWHRYIIADLISEVIYGTVVYFGMMLYRSGSLSLEDVAYVTGAALSVSMFLERVVHSLEAAYKSGSSLQDLFSITQVDENESIRPGTDVKGKALAFEHVSFSYEGTNENVLKDISFEVEPGELVALVGENGSGKSTIVQLAMGLLQPDSGMIFNMGRDNQVAVFQDYIKYETTLRDNVGFGNVRFLEDDPTLLEAMKKAGCEEMMIQKEMLDRTFGKQFDEKGYEPSGGQWQSLAVSRAMVGDRELLFFDEPSAALDPEAEISQIRQILEWYHDKSGLIVTHRIGIAPFCDKVLYLQNGQILEAGTHEELIRAGGAYYSLFQAQKEWYR